MPIVVGISLRTAGKLYYFDPGTERYYHGEKVLVETARGQELGTVKLPPHEVVEEQIVAPLKPVLRRATTADIGRFSANREREEHALEVCKRLVTKLNLPMRLIDAQYTLDCSHVLIHFLAENRVDFRELVRELARELHTRIELRQVGVRDEAKILGGFGICGRKLCCSAFLVDFAPVAISMAKDQGLALNPQKISGTCGRLMCCLAFECDQYRTEKAELPRLNAVIDTPQGMGKVTKLNVMSHQVEVSFPDAPPVWFSSTELMNGSEGKPATAPCCAGGREHACGRCHSHGEENGESIGSENVLLSTEDGIPIVTGEDEQRVDTTGKSEQSSSRAGSRRRRRKPSMGEKPSQPASDETKAPVKNRTAPGPASPDEKPKRPRRRKPRPEKNAETVAAPVAVPATGQASAGAARVPSGRYRPRRRRRPSGNDNSAPQA